MASLSLPIMASAFLGTAYNITDMAWIGLLGSKAVAGVGAGGMYVWLSQGLVALARMGGQVNVAQCCGKGDRERAAHFAAGAIQLTVLFGILFGVACLLFTDPLLGFFALEDQESYSAASVYMQADPVFFYESHADGAVYCPGRLQDAFSGKSDRSGR